MAHSVFIQGTNKRYSISKDGKVFSHYRYLNNGKKILQLKEIAKHLNCRVNNTVVVKLQIGKHTSKNSVKTFFVTKLMERCFDLNPPDRFHAYYLSYKDGNCFNVSIKNLVYKIRSQVGSSTKFYPKPFYSLNGTITHKVCGDCGTKKEIDFFYLQNPKKEGQNKTYRNSCEPCRAKRHWAHITSDIKRLKRHALRTKRWAETKEGKKYFHEYRKRRHKYEYENLTPHYLATSLRMNEKDLTPELISLSRKKLLLLRTIKQTTK